MPSNIRRCAVCGKSFEESRNSLFELMKGEIGSTEKDPDPIKDNYITFRENLLAEIKKFAVILNEHSVIDYPLEEILTEFPQYLEASPTLHSLLAMNEEHYDENELGWSSDYIEQLRSIRAKRAIDDMQNYLEKELHLTIKARKEYGDSLETAIRNVCSRYSMYKRTVTLSLGNAEKLRDLVLERKGKKLKNIKINGEGLTVEKQIDVCWICSSLFEEASQAAFEKMDEQNYDD